jgi:NAD dependent epimerase/dehydratase
MSALQGKKVLVTGAGGFIGSHLTETLLETGAAVRAFVRYNSRNLWGYLEELPADKKSGIEVISADLRDFQAVSRAVKNADVVFHLGALIGIPYSLQYPFDVVDTNVNGTLNVLQACLEQNVSRIIQTSTSEVYGTAQYTPMDENHPLNPQSPYAASKIAADKLAESFHRTYNLPVSILRPFNTFGPRQSLRAIIPSVITQLLQGKKLIIGNLAPRRDFTFVADTVRGFILLAGKSGVDGEVFNLGTGEDLTIGELVKLTSTIVGVEAEIVIEGARLRGNQIEVMQLRSDNSKAVKVLGWKPSYALEEGVGQTVEWMRKQKGLHKPGIYNV